MPVPPKNLRNFKSLVDVVTYLRGPEGCPWDKEQTHKSLTQYTLEEAYELAEALDSGSREFVLEELGDVLLQVVLHSEIARQSNEFEIDDVIEHICEKMIRRHPHVFADVKVNNSDEVLSNWQDIKDKEKGTKSIDLSRGIPKNLPALIYSQKLGSRTRKYNFDWQEASQVIEKLEEELSEFKQALASKNPKHTQHELGDVLFTLAQISRHLNLDAEQSLRMTNHRFEQRFQKMVDLCKESQRSFENLSSDELEELWSQAKSQLNTTGN